jgi:radical SAM superfamily enzyme YgiQ (UPF0313 family)
LNKETDVEQNYRAAEIIEKYGIMTGGAFIYGLPGQTEEDLEANIRFFDSFKFVDSGIAQINPLPGSKLFEELSRQGRIEPDSIEYWDKVKYFNEPVAELNFSEIPDEKYIEIFNKYANYIYEKCKKNIEDRFNSRRIKQTFFAKVRSLFK